VLEVVDRNAHHLFSLVNQILDFQRLGNLQNVLSLDVVDVVKAISDECEKYRLMAQQRGMDFHFNASAPHLFMMVDADKLQKVINNLLSNAFKFTPDGGSIAVEVKKEDQLMTLQVKDTGRGIAEADLAHIFERYYVSKDQQLGNVSTGLGLNIVKQYVEMHGGTISVSKNTPKGTVFTIQMKNVENIVSDQKQPDPQAPEVENLEGEHILLVEDNPDMLTYMSSVLAADYTIYQATDGQQALGIMQNTDIDLVISDVMMAGMDGLELVRRIKEDVNISHIPVILLTAKAMAEDELRGLQMGANDYITKPFNFDILRLRIREQLARREESHQRFIKSTEVNPSEITITTVDEQLLKQVLDVVNKNMGNPDFNVDQLAAELNMHRTGLNRKLQAVTGQKPIVFLRTMRLKRAKQILEADPSMMVSQIAYEVGFNNPKKFSKYFKEEYGMYPSEFTASLTENNG
jgi:DNA-binding response OmpR family regulator/two-component sensor histidine kinase